MALQSKHQALLGVIPSVLFVLYGLQSGNTPFLLIGMAGIALLVIGVVVMYAT